jgi:Co/Zn/Cd efflux system component
LFVLRSPKRISTYAGNIRLVRNTSAAPTVPRQQQRITSTKDRVLQAMPRGEILVENPAIYDRRSRSSHQGAQEESGLATRDMMEQSARPGLLLAVVVMAGVAVALAVAAAMTGSSVVLAQSVHALIAASSFSLGLLGLSAGRPGEAGERAFWVSVAPLLLYAFGAGTAVMEGAQRLAAQGAPGKPGTAYAILAGTAVVLAVALIAILRGSSRPREGDADAGQLVVQIGAVLAGNVVAAVGFGAADRGGWSPGDRAASLAIGIVMAMVAATLALRVRRILCAQDRLRELVVAAAPVPTVAEPTGGVVALETKSLPIAASAAGVVAEPSPRPVQPGGKPAVVARGQGKKGHGNRR